MSFEDRFARLGRRIDDLVYAVTSRRRPSIRVGPSVGERLADRMHSAQDWVAEQRSKVSANRIDQMDPRTRTVVMLVCAMAVGGAAVGLSLYFFGGGRGGSLTSEEVQALQKMKGSGGTSMFATPPPPTAGDAGTRQPTRPRGGGLTGGK